MIIPFICSLGRYSSFPVLGSPLKRESELRIFVTLKLGWEGIIAAVYVLEIRKKITYIGTDGEQCTTDDSHGINIEAKGPQPYYEYTRKTFTVGYFLAEDGGRKRKTLHASRTVVNRYIHIPCLLLKVIKMYYLCYC